MVTKEEFNKVWKDSTKEDILNQFYFEHIAIRKAIEYINNTIEDKPLTDFDCGSNNACNDLLNILQNGDENDGN